jgi:signal transduction histidine kinase
LTEVGEETRIHLYRIVQECMSNVVAHAQARRLRLWLGVKNRAGRPVLRLVCRDDGRGLDLDAPRSGYGLITMRERVRALGGHFDLQSRPGKGLRLLVEAPLRA